jgi:hypothetical protein
MDEIIKLSETIDNTININEKVNMIQLLNGMIQKEKTELNNILENNISNLKVKIPLKYKKMSINELEELFNNTSNINEKIIIYHAITKSIENVITEMNE